MLVAPPDSELVGCCVCEFFEKFVCSCGAQNDRACATPTSEICGSMRWMRIPRFCSRASLTASSIDRRRTDSPAGGAAVCAAAVWREDDMSICAKADTDVPSTVNATAEIRKRITGLLRTNDQKSLITNRM